MRKRILHPISRLATSVTGSISLNQFQIDWLRIDKRREQLIQGNLISWKWSGAENVYFNLRTAEMGRPQIWLPSWWFGHKRLQLALSRRRWNHNQHQNSGGNLRWIIYNTGRKMEVQTAWTEIVAKIIGLSWQQANSAVSPKSWE